MCACFLCIESWSLMHSIHLCKKITLFLTDVHLDTTKSLETKLKIEAGNKTPVGFVSARSDFDLSQEVLVKAAVST